MSYPETTTMATPYTFNLPLWTVLTSAMMILPMIWRA